MLLLAVDTSTRRGSVALRRDGVLLGEECREMESGHSGWLLGAVEALLVGAGCGPADLAGLAVTTGPGSFTGLRVGLATVQGLAMPGEVPCLGLPTLDVLAWGVRGMAPRLFAVMDAWRGEVYAREYDTRAEATGEAEVLAPEALAARARASEAAFFGDGALRYREALETGAAGAVFPDRSLFLAASLAEMAEARLSSGEGRPAAELRPVYLRPPALKAPKR